MRPIGIDWQIADFTGWGVFGLNLIHAMLPQGIDPVVVEEPADVALDPLRMAAIGPVLERARTIAAAHPKVDDNAYMAPFPMLVSMGNLAGINGRFVGRDVSLGLIYSEDTAFDDAARSRAGLMTALLAGCKWSQGMLQANGCENVLLWRQGVDPSRYAPRPRTGLWKGRYLVFIGGQLSYRKGQDIAVAAFKAFHERHPEALLVAACQSAWPRYARGLTIAGHAPTEPTVSGDRLDLARWLRECGLPDDSYRALGFVANPLVPELLRDIDVALFTNRCEASTNFVAMEAIAMGVPTILSANTGHLDLIEQGYGIPLKRQSAPKPCDIYGGIDGWGETDVEEVVDALETAYTRAAVTAHYADTGSAEFRRDWSWSRRVEQLVDILADIGVKEAA